MRLATWSRVPVCTSTGPPTRITLPPRARMSRSRWAISWISNTFGFSLETLLPMKAKTCGCVRGRSRGVTRTPSWPTTSCSPALTSGQRHRPGAPRLRVDGDAAVHFRPLHLHPVARQAHRGFQVGRRVKPFGEHAVGRRGHQVDLLDLLGQRPDALGSIQQQLEQFAVGRRDLDAGVRRLVLATADLDVLDHELAAAIHHLVHDLRQRVRVDDVAA